MKYKVNTKQQKGTTLVELILYMGLISILLIILTDMLVGILDVKVESEGQTYAEQDLKYISSRIQYDIHRADSIVSPSLGNNANTLVLNINSENHTYSLSGSTLQLTNSSGTFNVTSNQTQVSNLDFLVLGNPGGNNTVTVTYTVTGNARRKGLVEELSNRVTLGIR